MAEKIEFDASGFTSLKAQIREANIEYQALLSNVEATPEALQAAATKVADLKNQFDDANDAVNALTQTGKFAALTKGLAAVSGGFTAMQGAITLVGGDVKDFEKTFQKLQAAMALTQGLTALADVADAFGAIKIAAVGAFNAIKVAIGSTGVGLLIVGLGIAVGALINYMNELTEAEERSKKQTEDMNKALERQLALSEDISRRRDNQLKIDVARAEFDKKSLKEISALKQRFYQQERDDSIKNVRQINADKDKELAKFRGTEEEKQKIIDKYDGLRKNQIQRRNSAETSLDLEKISLQNQINAEAEKNEQKRKDREEKALAKRVKALESLKALDLAEIESQKNAALALAKTDQERLGIEDQFAAKKIEREKQFEKDREGLRVKGEKDAVALEAKLKNLDNQRVESAAKTKDGIAKLDKADQDKKDKDTEDAKKKAKQDAEDLLKINQDAADAKASSSALLARETIRNEEQLSEKLIQIEIQRLKDQMALLEKGSKEQLALAVQIAEAEQSLSDKTAKTKLDNLQKQVGATLDAAAQVFEAAQAFSDRDKNRELEALKARGLNEEEAAKKTDEINKEYFEKNKSVQVGQAIISTLQSSISAFASLATIPVVGPALGAIAAAAALAAGYATVQQIQETTYTSSLKSSSGGSSSTPSTYAEGGLLQGNSHNMGGIRTSMGELEGGEFVINRRATANFLPLLESINSLGNTNAADVPMAQTPIVKTYVVATDMTSQQEANARLNALARL
jgi:hypothetical protein